jgi:hypothetical protein
MTRPLDTSALLAHYLAEPGANIVQALFEDEDAAVGTSILSLFEFDLRLHQLNMDESTRTAELNRYRALMSEVVNVDDLVRNEAVRLRIQASSRVASMDVLIAATASSRNAILVHRDPHFTAIPAGLLKQDVLPSK